jgi:predicted permease
MLSRLWSRLRGLFLRRRACSEADEELAFHFDRETATHVADGMSLADARRRARADLGAVRAKDRVRETRMTWLDLLSLDLRYALRGLRRTPTFTVSAVATLAIVIGANGAAFSLADTVLLRSLPYPQPSRMGALTWFVQSGGSSQFAQDFTGRAWEAVRDGTKALDVAAMSRNRDRVNFNGDDTTAFVVQARVSEGYFRVLGVGPSAGRTFTADEDRPGGASVVVLGHAFATRTFMAPASAVGRTLLLRGKVHEVVGVLRPDFVPLGEPADVFTPLRASRVGEGGGLNFRIITRVRDGRTWSEASGELDSIGQALIATGQRRPPPGEVRRLGARPLQDALTSDVRTPIQMILGCGVLVLLIACVNLAALVLARGSTRSAEIAARLALGSSRAAIVRQCIVESLLLGVLGGVLGGGVAEACVTMLRTGGAEVLTLGAEPAIDLRVIAVTATISILAAVLFGLMPALASSRVDVRVALAAGGPRIARGGTRRWARRTLIATQVALSVVLLVVAGLFARTLRSLDTLEPGFNADGLVTTSVSLQDERYVSAARINQLFDAALDTLSRTPGVQSAAVSLGLPYDRLLNYGFRFADRPVEGSPLVSNFMYITPTFFETFGIPVRSGRAFTAADGAGQAPVVIVNDAFVRYVSGGESPMGRALRFNNLDWRIVGIVGDVQTLGGGPSHRGMVRGPLEASPVVFFPAGQLSDAFAPLVHQWFMPSWTVRTSDAAGAESALRRAIHMADSLLPTTAVIRIGEVQARATSLQRLLLTLVGAFAGVALLLAVIGIYGLMAQTVVERTREFGVRLALGATAGTTIRDVIRSGLLLAGVGVAVGVALAWGATRLISSLIWGVGAHDPLTFVAVSTVLLVFAAAASLVPALRILRLDPARILRG